MSVCLLGPVEVLVDGRTRPVNGLRRKAVLAALALTPDRVVSTDRLIDVVWGDRPPATAVNSLQRHVSYLRRQLGTAAEIEARSAGYLLTGCRQPTDVQSARRLLDRAGECVDPTERVAVLRTAVALWRGRPLADLAGLPWLAEQAQHLDLLRLDVERAFVAARLAVGDHERLVPELAELARQHPVDERLHGQLMLALYRSGRQADALATFRRLREALAAELGVDPGPALRDLETAILRQDSTVDPPRGAGVEPAVAPAQLPADAAVFAGRATELAALDRLTDTRGAARIAVLSGQPGVGKTTLAIRWAQHAAAAFPDGQLYVNLHGYAPEGALRDTLDVLREFLQALGVSAARLPAGREAAVNLYRSVLAGKRVLVVLDNARDADQVRPLLPGAPGCRAVVTSRDQLTGLVAAEGAWPLVLDPLPPDDARDMLARRLGTDRVTADPSATEAIIARCGRLPLALAVVAARAATRPGFPLGAIAATLDPSTGVLDMLTGGDAATDVRAVFSWSCRALSGDALRLFRLLSLHPGPDASALSAAAIGGIPRADVGPLLDELTRANLLGEPVHGRYAFHDLLRAYAADLTDTLGTPADRAAAVRRVLEHYLHTADVADRREHPRFSDVRLVGSGPAARSGPPIDRSAATAWFAAERAVLTAAVRTAWRAGFDVHAWQLGWVISGSLNRTGHWRDSLATERLALAAAERAGDPIGRAHIHRILGTIHSRLGEHRDADEHLRRALVLFVAGGDRAGAAHTNLNLGQALERRSDLRRALEHTRRALVLFETAGAAAGQAYTHNAIGWQLGQLGDHDAALASCRTALLLLEKVGDVQGIADTWDSLGYIHHQLGEHDRAIACYEQALRHFGEVSDRYGESCTEVNIGRSHEATGRPAAARNAWHRALIILDQLGHPDADQVRTELLGRTAVL